MQTFGFNCIPLLQDRGHIRVLKPVLQGSRAAVHVYTHIEEVEPVSADGVQNPQQQNDLQRGVVERNTFWRFRYEV